MIYFAPSARLQIGNNVTIQITAPESGTFRGIGIYVDRDNSNPMIFGNNVTLQVDGAIYAAGADVSFRNSINLAFRQCVVGTLDVRNGNVAMLD